ncbi:MAG: ribonuclease HII [Deferrisomatales bacterium]|nr:ribonuclease HII [Deferrisomatales bacterium]
MPAAPLPLLGEPDGEAFAAGYRQVCGVDEVGRGPLAGPVVAAAVVLPPHCDIPGLGDSKKLTARARARLVPEICGWALATGIGVAEADEIDRVNILQASLQAMARAVKALGLTPDFLLVDGVHPVPSPFPQRTLVGGDGLSRAIAAASILAKQYRDALMVELGGLYPGYGLETHMGYPTPSHRAAVRRLGPSAVHRRTFKGVREFAGPPLQPPPFAEGPGP